MNNVKIFKKLVELFNSTLRELIIKGKFLSEKFREKPLTYEQTVILIDQIYARSVTDPDALRGYRGIIQYLMAY